MRRTLVYAFFSILVVSFLLVIYWLVPPNNFKKDSIPSQNNNQDKPKSQNLPPLRQDVLEPNSNDASTVSPKGEESLKYYNIQTNLPSNVKKMIEESIKEGSSLNIASSINAGFIETEAKKLNDQSGKQILNFDKLPQLIKSTVQSQIDFREKNGYDKVSNAESSLIVDSIRQAIKGNIPAKKISFDLIDDNFMRNLGYEYYGYIFPNGFRNQESDISDTVSRVYLNSNNKNEMVIIQESNLGNGSAVLIDSFVNRAILNYPASFSHKKSDSNQEYSLLAFSIGKSDFNLYQVNDKLNDSSLLEAIGTFIGRQKEIENKDTKQASVPNINIGGPPPLN